MVNIYSKVDKITPNDPRITHKYATLNGKKYHYILAIPESGDYRATIFLIHGFPDLAFAWRYQIPFLTGLGLRCVAPDMMGYGDTEAPEVESEDYHMYGFKRAADDLAALAKQLEASNVIVAGHDWGGMIAYRFAQWCPEVVKHIIVVATPYAPKLNKYVDLKERVKHFPQLGYQLQFEGPNIKNAMQTREDYIQFFKAFYGGRSASGKQLMVPRTGLALDLLKEPIGSSPLADDMEVEYYADQFRKNGIDKALNWYRNRATNFKEEKDLPTNKVQQPTLFVLAAKDDILTRDMATGIGKYIPNLTRQEVATGHWALWQAPQQVNDYMKDWLNQVVFAGRSTL
ncbi:hypothetical protein MBLNU457_4794t1 [Dothideomycetes sp. NU457]